MDFGLGRALPRSRQPRRLLAVASVSIGYVRHPGTCFGASALLWTSFVVPGPDVPSGSGLHIAFRDALKVSDFMEHLEIPTKGVGKVPSLKSPVAFRMRFGRRKVRREDRFVRHAHESAMQALFSQIYV